MTVDECTSLQDPQFSAQFAGPRFTLLRGSRGPDRLFVSGEVDLSTTDELRRSLRVLTGPGSSSPVVVDLAGVTFMGCAALTPLLEAKQQCGQRLEFAGVSPAVQRLLRLTGLAAHFGTVTSTGLPRLP